MARRHLQKGRLVIFCMLPAGAPCGCKQRESQVAAPEAPVAPSSHPVERQVTEARISLCETSGSARNAGASQRSLMSAVRDNRARIGGLARADCST
jgi:hypothetical protein